MDKIIYYMDVMGGQYKSKEEAEKANTFIFDNNL